MRILQGLWERVKAFSNGVWSNYSRWILIGSIIFGLLLIAFSIKDSGPYAVGIFLMFAGIVGGIYRQSRTNFWGSNAFFLIVMGVFIAYLMTVFTVPPDKIQGLLTAYITIDTAIIAVIFAAIAIRPEHFTSVKKEVRDFLLITSFWILLSILIYCMSFFDLYNTSIGFKVFLGGTTTIQIVLIFNFMRLADSMFDRIVPQNEVIIPEVPQPVSDIPVVPPERNDEEKGISGKSLVFYEGFFIFFFGILTVFIEFYYFYTTVLQSLSSSPTWVYFFVHAIEASSPGITLTALGLAFILGAKELKK